MKWKEMDDLKLPFKYKLKLWLRVNMIDNPVAGFIWGLKESARIMKWAMKYWRAGYSWECSGRLALYEWEAYQNGLQADRDRELELKKAMLEKLKEHNAATLEMLRNLKEAEDGKLPPGNYNIKFRH